MLYRIYAGLGGSFGGAQLIGEWEFDSREAAESAAFAAACDEYENYDGMYGLRSVDEIAEEEECDEDEALRVWEEERESWLDYYVEEV